MTIRSFLVILLTLFVLACARKETSGPAVKGSAAEGAAATTASIVEVGSPMPYYAAAFLDGSTFDISKERGNVVLLNLWATWCGPCRYEIPELQKMHDAYSSRGFKVIGVSVDEGDSRQVKAFADDQKITYPIVHDPRGRLAVLMETNILPTSVLVDRSGKVIWKKLGVVTSSDAEMLRALTGALKG